MAKLKAARSKPTVAERTKLRAKLAAFGLKSVDLRDLLDDGALTRGELVDKLRELLRDRPKASA